MEQEHSNLEKTLLALVCDKCNQTLPNNYDKSNKNDQMIDTLEYQDLDLNEIKDKPDVYCDFECSETDEKTPILSCAQSNSQSAQSNLISLRKSNRLVDDDTLVLELKNEIFRLNNILENKQLENNCIDKFQLESPVMLACKRLPALFLTLFIELVGGIIISNFNGVIKKYTLLVSFMPALSALSGNLGLQAGANTIRGLGTGHIKRGGFRKNFSKELKSGIVCATMISITIGLVGMVWSISSKEKIEHQEIDKIYPHHAFTFGLVLFFGSWISMMIACFNGAGTPILADSFGLDPAKVAGPLETALQDIFGQTFLLGASFAVFSFTEPYFWYEVDRNDV